MPNPVGPIRSGLTPQGRDNNPGRCCARCKTPYGHSAEAGQCCHPRTGENR